MIRIIVIVIMALAVQWCVATSFHLPRLQKIATSIDMQVADSLLLPNKEVDSVAIVKGRAVYLRTDCFGDVAHIGYRLFPQCLRERYRGVPIFDFLERYLLELDLRIDGRDPDSRMDIDHVVVSKGTLQLLHQLNSQTTLSATVDEITRKMYRLELNVGGQELIAVIPADNQLLFGGNLIELEQSFISGVNRMIAFGSDAVIHNWGKMEAKNREGDLVVDGGVYRIEEIRGDIYLTKHNGKRQLLIDRKSPLRSVSNMMLTGIAPQEVTLLIDFHVYGNKRDRRQVTLQQFVAYCKSEGCQLYFGTKTLTDSLMTGTLFAYNEKYAYTHMLSATIPLDILEGSGQPIRGHAYVYIPLHDITEKYIRSKK